jgi:hypothetical protein
MIIAISIFIGLLAGVHAATWGMYKDAPHEGFSGRKYVRSPIVGSALGPFVAAATGADPRHASGGLLLFGAVYVVERALAEIYKTFVREEDQSKYFIPMQLHVLGTVVRSRPARLLAGAVYVAILLGLLGFVARLGNSTGRPATPVILTIGGLGGWISAFGGAWKDAPAEGFQIFKFFRSPFLATLLASGLSTLSSDLLVVTLAATGYTIATTETYKTFFFPSKPRGKFAGKPVRYPEMLLRRRSFVPPYVAIWAGLLLATIEAARA